jgi:hypothetical protein
MEPNEQKIYLAAIQLLAPVRPVRQRRTFGRQRYAGVVVRDTGFHRRGNNVQCGTVLQTPETPDWYW